MLEWVIEFCGPAAWGQFNLEWQKSWKLFIDFSIRQRFQGYCPGVSFPIFFLCVMDGNRFDGSSTF
jgi:hypothetical protein